MNKTWTDYVVCLLDLMDNRSQKGLFFLTSDKSIGEVSQKFGVNALKNRLGLRWEVHITKIKSAESPSAERPEMCHTPVAVVKKIIDKLKTESAVIILPENNPDNSPWPPKGYLDPKDRE